MRTIRVLLSRGWGALTARRRDAELEEELRAHLDLLTCEHQQRGLSYEAARRAACRDFGGLASMTESYRAQRGIPLLDTVAQDVRYALRMWRRAPGFSLLVIAVLALGIGANSAMFTIVNALLFRPLSGRAAELVGLYSHDPKQPNSYRMFSYPNYADIRDRNDVFDSLIAYSFTTAGMPGDGAIRRTFVELVSANFFSTIGVSLAVGRTFTPDEDKPGANLRVAIANYGLWRESGFDPAFLGRTLRVNAQDFTIVGVAPAGFTGTNALMAPELWLPIGVFDSIVNDVFKNTGRGLADRSNTALLVAGRLKPRVTIETANARLAGLSADLDRAYPGENRRQLLTAHALSRVNVSTTPQTDSGPAVLSAVLMPLSGSVLLIACLNIANMLLARSTARRKEIAIRIALGGGRMRIIRQLLSESLVLAAAGAAGGLLLGWWITRLLARSLVPILPMPLQLETRPDPNIILATTLFAILSSLVFGLAPALKISRPDLVDDLKDLGGAREAGHRLGMRAWLVVCQVAVSLMLMTVGGLFARAALRADVTDPGYRYDGLLLASIEPGLAGYDAGQGHARLQSALERLRRVPGIVAVGASSQVPFGDFHEGRAVARPGRGYELRRTPTYTLVTADYFKAIGLPIIRGRDFARDDASSAVRRAVIVDEPLARNLFPDEDPVGQLVMIPAHEGRAPSAENETTVIVGVVPGIRDDLFQREPTAHIYVPWSAQDRAPMHLHVRTDKGAEREMLAVVRRELRAVDDRLPVVELRTMQEFHNRGLLLWLIRTAGRTLSALGGLALLLAVVGVYGVKSFVVSRRTREIGIRLALGASPRDIGWMLVRDGARMTLVGVAIGFPLALVVGRLLSAAIVEVSPFDPIVLTLAPMALTGAAALATYLPARRGMRVSPLDALRTE